MFLLRSFIVVMVALVVSAVVFAASPLETNQWRVELTPPGAPAPHFIDRIRFENGNFTSVIFERKEFLSSSYSTTKRDNSVAWKAEQSSKTEGELVWKGELQGDTMTGTLAWKQPDGKTTQYAMYGKPMQEEKAEASAAEAEKTTVPESGSATVSKSWWGCSLVR